MKEMVAKCPICDGHDFDIIKISCRNCKTTIEGKFKLNRLGSLSREHQEFIEVFVKCRGNIKDVEKALNISYPTVRSRLDRAIGALTVAEADRTARRREILQALENNEIDPAEAASALKELT